MVIYLDGADLVTMARFEPHVQGFTTNPSLMKKAGVTNYEVFAKEVLGRANGKPVSFEVLADDWETMEAQAQRISDWGDNVWVKIPITNTKGESSVDLIDRLQDLNLNITAVMTQQQIDALLPVVRSHHIISVFAGRIADTGRTPPWIPRRAPIKAKMLWASTRQTRDIDIAGELGYDIITMTPDLVAKLPLRGKDLNQYSLETVQQFYKDAEGITL